MRLSKIQIEQIHQTISLFFKDTTYDLYLYGSRTQDHLKGGDIDLLILTNKSGLSIFEQKHLDILVELKKKSEIGQRRIDIKAALSENLNKEPFLITIKSEIIKI